MQCAMFRKFALDKYGQFLGPVALQRCAHPAGENIGDQRFCLCDDQGILIALQNDAGEIRRELLGTAVKREVGLVTNSKDYLRVEAPHHLADLAQVTGTDSRGVEAAIWPQYTPDLRQGLRSIRNMVEHVVGDHHIEARVGEGDRLRIDDLELKRIPAASQVAPRLRQHPWREIRERNIPLRRDAFAIVAPQSARPAAKLKDAAARGSLELIEDPRVPAVGV